jgi:hypothetical protein
VGGRNKSRGKHHDESSDRPAGSCETGNSFDPNTLVLMADGSRKPIKDVKLGDKVLATDPTTGKSAAREVTDVRSHTSRRTLVEVTIGTDTGTSSVVATDEHPFWVASDKRWSHAIDLKPGHKLATPDNRDATITGTRSWSEVRRVHNLTIDTDHTYYVVVGLTSVLVHNCAKEAISQLSENQQEQLLSRVVRGDKKGRPFGSPQVPRMPTLDEFNPRFADIRAGDLADQITSTKHGIFPDQATSVGQMPNDDLIRLRMEDPISATRGPDHGLGLTGGHHRTAEIANRVVNGRLSPDTIVRVLIHD